MGKRAGDFRLMHLLTSGFAERIFQDKIFFKKNQNCLVVDTIKREW
jgi:hypothetical protein